MRVNNLRVIPIPQLYMQYFSSIKMSVNLQDVDNIDPGTKTMNLTSKIFFITPFPPPYCLS
jgi:hypothetical protein